MVQNKAIIFKSVPQGAPIPGKDLVVESREFDLEQAPPSGGVTTKNIYVSFDPYMRELMTGPSKDSYSESFELGKPIHSGAVSKILKSDNPKFAAGDVVVGFVNNEEYSAISQDAANDLEKVDNPHNLDLKLFLGALGMTGLTAYSSLYAIGKPKKGETIFISAASGAVGQIVGQLAKREGLRVIGSVGSDDKLNYILKELNFDGGFNYKTEKAGDALERLAPDGVDIYYDNVGGEQLQAALEVMNNFGRIVGSGMISEYNKKEGERYGVTNLLVMVAKRITFSGFIVSDPDMGPVYFQERNKNVSQWLMDGTLKSKESVIDGIDNGPEGFVGMLEGKNFGKAVLKIADE